MRQYAVALEREQGEHGQVGIGRRYVARQFGFFEGQRLFRDKTKLV